MIRIARLVALGTLILLVAVAGCSFTPQATQTVAELTTQAAELLAQATAIPTQTYVVQPGDTPKGVALMFGTTVETLIDLNADTHPEMGWAPMKFNAGWQLLVPRQTSSPITSGGSDSQVIQSSATVTTEVPIVASERNDGSFDYDGALEIIRLTNEERAKAGLAPLTIDETLMEIARKRATEIVSDWGHQGLDDDCAECGENISKFGSVDQQFLSWMSSEGHRGNILATEYTQSGVGRYIVSGKAYAAELFK